MTSPRLILLDFIRRLKPLALQMWLAKSYRISAMTAKRLLAMPLLVLTLLLLSGIHPEAHTHEHETEHAGHCQGHDHDSSESENSTSHQGSDQQSPLCACACHGVAADRTVDALPTMEELVYAEASCPVYAVPAVDEPLLDIFHPPKLAA